MAPKGAVGGGPATLQQKSPAEFFAENKNIAGFDNPGKCLYTTVRELVENSLDSAESVSALPLVEITIEEISHRRLNQMRGIANHDRIDAALYQDHETEDARKKREARELKEREKAAKAAARAQGGGGTAAASAAAAAAAASAAVQAAQNAQAAQRATGAQYYRVTVRDNGAGMPHDDIPDMLGRVLSGTKYGVRQTRGKFGLGAKMALIWSKMTTGLPFEIRAATEGSPFVSRYVLDIDIHRNEPTVHRVSKDPQPAAAAAAGAGGAAAGGAAAAGAAAAARGGGGPWRGAELSVTIEGNWTKYRSYILKYLRQIAVITPYAQFAFTFVPERAASAAAAAGAPPAGSAGAPAPPGSLRLLFKRRTDAMPPPPAVTRHHPSSVDLEQVKRLLAETKAPTMAAFLTREFDAVDRPLALRLLGELKGAGLKADGPPPGATAAQAARLHHLLREARFRDPTGGHLSPAGEYNLRLGVMKELDPELIATHQGEARVFEGHAFVVEAAVSVGGRDIKPGINVHRFANRIPLLFEAGSDVVTRTATKRINWASYKINQATDRVGVFVSIVSTKIPFKGAGKEYVADDVEEIVSAIKGALQACGAQLRAKIARRMAAREQAQRRRNLTKYIPDACGALWGVLQAMAEAPPDRAGPKRRRLVEAARGGTGGEGSGRELLERVTRGTVTLATLQSALSEHVERIDTDLALEYQVRQGVAAGADKCAAFLVPLSAPEQQQQQQHRAGGGGGGGQRGGGLSGGGGGGMMELRASAATVMIPAGALMVPPR